MHSNSLRQGMKVFQISVLLIMMLQLPACGNFCFFGICPGNSFDVSERNYDIENNEFTIAGETKGNDISHTYRLGEKKQIDDLSFGVTDADLFRKYGAIKQIDRLSSHALKTYMDNYVIPQKNCPAVFMKDNLEIMMLVAATDDIAIELEEYDIPFDGKGTEFSLTGHDLTHISNRYLENGKSINLTIPKTLGVSSNVGSTNRKIHYFLVTEISPLSDNTYAEY